MKSFSIKFRLTSMLLALAAISFLGICGSVRVFSQAPSSKILPSPKSTAAPPAPKEVALPRLPLNLDIVFKALRSDKATTAEKNQLLIQGVRERGISFVMTPEVEEELAEQGAGKALIELLNKKSAQFRESPFFYRSLADDFIYKKNFNQAIANYNKTIELDPADKVAYNNRGRAFEELKRYEEAFADFTKVIEIDPTDRTGYNNRGVIYYIKSDYPRAIEDYTKAIEIDPKFFEAYVHRANAYQMLGKLDLAKADRQKAKELER